MSITRTISKLSTTKQKITIIFLKISIWAKWEQARQKYANKFLAIEIKTNQAQQKQMKEKMCVYFIMVASPVL